MTETPAPPGPRRRRNLREDPVRGSPGDAQWLSMTRLRLTARGRLARGAAGAGLVVLLVALPALLANRGRGKPDLTARLCSDLTELQNAFRVPALTRTERALRTDASDYSAAGDEGTAGRIRRLADAVGDLKEALA